MAATKHSTKGLCRAQRQREEANLHFADDNNNYHLLSASVGPGTVPSEFVFIGS